jgi:hypothetical protein
VEERIVAPDPVLEPDAYKQALLDLLGSRDPLEVMALTPSIYQEKTDGLSDEMLHRRPEPSEWSIEELLGHFWHGEIVYSFRWRLILAQPEPVLTGYDQDAWTDIARPPFHDMLDAFTALRHSNLVLARDTPRDRWSRYGKHEERGEESFELGLNLIAGHDLAHLKQLDKTLAGIGAITE